MVGLTVQIRKGSILGTKSAHQMHKVYARVDAIYIFLDRRPHGGQSMETGHDCNVDCHETCHLFSLMLLKGRKYIFLKDDASQLKIGI